MRRVRLTTEFCGGGVFGVGVGLILSQIELIQGWHGILGLLVLSVGALLAYRAQQQELPQKPA